jgi:hypothetical protein
LPDYQCDLKMFEEKIDYNMLGKISKHTMMRSSEYSEMTKGIFDKYNQTKENPEDICTGQKNTEAAEKNEKISPWYP